MHSFARDKAWKAIRQLPVFLPSLTFWSSPQVTRQNQSKQGTIKFHTGRTLSQMAIFIHLNPSLPTPLLFLCFCKRNTDFTTTTAKFWREKQSPEEIKILGQKSLVTHSGFLWMLTWHIYAQSSLHSRAVMPHQLQSSLKLKNKKSKKQKPVLGLFPTKMMCCNCSRLSAWS